MTCFRFKKKNNRKGKKWSERGLVGEREREKVEFKCLNWKKKIRKKIHTFDI